ncbi:hypothetical protein E2C01_003686 [Portunus trituberculatus]|uniref:Uncharacterized protein n=1 Tax=Portunus trituberculatus TaxID=210409 RepID=A0A5B7CU66_PORTR|nr:hypothetical protein [Portunus trituberculatus]
MLIFPGMITVSVSDASLCAERIMEAYIAHSFSQPKPSKPWFNRACSRAVHDREVAHKRYLSLPSPESHALYISARNHAKSVLKLAKHCFINRKCQNLSNSNSLCAFYHLAKNISSNFTSSSFSPLFHSDGTTAISSVSEAKLFSQIFAKNSTPWMILGLSLSLLLPLTISCVQSEFFIMVFSIPSESLWGPSYCSQKLCFCACTLHVQTLSIMPINFYLSFLLEVCLHSSCS